MCGKKTGILFVCICSTLSCYDKLGIKDHLIIISLLGIRRTIHNRYDVKLLSVAAVLRSFEVEDWTYVNLVFVERA